MRDVKDRVPPRPDHQKDLVKTIEALGYRDGLWQVFADFVEMGAISVANAVDLGRREKREERYMHLIKRYKSDELAKFPEMLASLTMALEEETSDVLGRTFHDLELHNKWSGQYFSPYPLCRMMAKMTIGDKAFLEAKISERGFVTAQEPAAGSGAMVIALAHEIRDLGINYQQHLHVTAIDIDPKCVHMSYLQLSLLHIPAEIIHGNSLSLETFDTWYTPAHIMGAWTWKLRHATEPDGETEIASISREATRPEAENNSPPTGSQLSLF